MKKSLKLNHNSNFIIIFTFLFFIFSCITYYNKSNASEIKTINTLSDFKIELNKIIKPNQSLSPNNPKIQEIVKNTDKNVLKAFVQEKLDKVASLDLSSSLDQRIDLGDGCSVIQSSDKSNGISNRDAAKSQTLWKNYGARQYTSYTNVFFVIGYIELNLCNHYTLGSNGITPRYVEAYENSSGLATTSHGEINQPRRYAKQGQTVSSNCIFKVNVGLKDVNITFTYKMYNYIKCQEIDKNNRRVKVIQSWEGEHL